MKGRVLLLAVLSAAVAAGCGPKIKNDPPTGETIVAFGDSLTSGAGAVEGGTYPDYLSKLLGEPVLNRGISGNTTEDGLKRIEKDVFPANPRIVIVWLGCNDVLRQLPGTEAVENLGRIVDTIQARGALVVLVGVQEVPFRPGISDEVIHLAKEKGCVYVPNPMSGILLDPELKSDEVHPNSKGYALIAERIAKQMKRYAKRS